MGKAEDGLQRTSGVHDPDLSETWGDHVQASRRVVTAVPAVGPRRLSGAEGRSSGFSSKRPEVAAGSVVTIGASRRSSSIIWSPRRRVSPWAIAASHDPSRRRGPRPASACCSVRTVMRRWRPDSSVWPR